MHFNPNHAAQEGSGIYGLPFSPEESRVVLFPVPWEAAACKESGTAGAPREIFKASYLIDLFDIDLGFFYKPGIALLPEDESIREWNKQALKLAERINQRSLSQQQNERYVRALNTISEEVNNFIMLRTREYLKNNKIVGIIGGDHSVSFGAIRAIHDIYSKMGVLQIDAHADMRKEYNGLHHSHASVMFNVMTKTSIEKLVQVGVREFCEEEHQFAQTMRNRVTTFFDQNVSNSFFLGSNWSLVCEEIVSELPDEIYISVDADGFDPTLCRHSSTPVPGGLSFQQFSYLLKTIIQSKRKIVGFDLTEVSSNSFDAAVGARILLKLIGWTLRSQQIV